MISQPVAYTLIGAVLIAFISLRATVNFGGVGGFAFNVLTFIAAFAAATYVWRRVDRS